MKPTSPPEEGWTFEYLCSQTMSVSCLGVSCGISWNVFLQSAAKYLYTYDNKIILKRRLSFVEMEIGKF